MTCRARRYGDQMICEACGLNWDANDLDPPACRKNIKRAVAKVAKVEAERMPDRPAPRPRGLPVDLPADVAAEMVKTYQAHHGGLSGMRAAYRLFLDRVEP